MGICSNANAASCSRITRGQLAFGRAQRLQVPERCSTEVTQTLDGLNDCQGVEAIILCCTQ